MNQLEKLQHYTGSCYIGIVGSENENGECRDSIEAITRRKKDELHYVRATKGFEARQMHLNNWYEQTKHPFMLLLDHDMKFPAFALERLRNWKLPYVSGLYMRRRYAPMAPVWFDYGQPGQMPMTPYTGVPMPNQLYKIGASGWGCVLLHRDVVAAVKPLLKGEPEIIEDDMDVYPYDLKRVMGAIKAMRAKYTEYGPFGGSMCDIQESLEILEQEIRPLRVVKDPVGSDIRFPFFARLAGFDLYGGAGVMCEHMLNYPLSPSDYINQSAANVRDVTMAIQNDRQREIEKIQKATAEL